MAKGKQGPKRTYLEREDHYALIAKLDRRGYTQCAIAEKLGLSPSQVSLDVKEMRRRYYGVQMAQTGEMIREKLAQYREVRKEAWEAYDRSKEDHVTRRQELVPIPHEEGEDEGGKGREGSTSYKESMRRLKVIITREGRLPENRYLQTILDTLKAEEELCGLIPKDPAPNVNVQVINWDAFHLAPEKRDIDSDPVEEEIRRAALPPPNHKNGSSP
jgi:hypothetical protein